MFNVGDQVFVPNAFEWVWESCSTKINSIEIDENGNTVYYADCPHNPLTNNEGCKIEEFRFEENEVFKDRKECDKYISNYYYDGLCTGCEYDKIAGDIWRCNDCEYVTIVKNDDPSVFDKKICSRTGVIVGGTYSAGSECCKFYTPKLKQNIKAYVSWEHYDDILRNCEFNPECEHHKNSCHKTCPYDRYMNNLVSITLPFDFDGRHVKHIKIPRKMWIDQSFIAGDIIQCEILLFDPVLTKTGKMKKGAINFLSFGKLQKINIKTGKLVD